MSDGFYEDAAKEKGYKFIVGIDEVGRGAAANAVVAAAVRIPDHIMPSLIGRVKDSKKISFKKREALFDMITYSCDCGVGIIGNEIIDEINILEATKLAMRKALSDVKYADYALIDGNFEVPGLNVPQQNIIRGDELSISISAASIVAKVTRDELMKTTHNVYPIYGWDKNKGYLTKEHIKALKLYGPSEFHRLTFNKVVQ